MRNKLRKRYQKLITIKNKHHRLILILIYLHMSRLEIMLRGLFNTNWDLSLFLFLLRLGLRGLILIGLLGMFLKELERNLEGVHD